MQYNNLHTSHRRPATYLHLPSLRQAQLNNYTIPTIWIWVMNHPLLFGDQFSTATKIPTTSHYSLHPDHDLRILWPQLPTTKMPIPPRWSGRQNYCPCVFGGSRLSPLRLLYNYRRHQWHKICHLICEDPTTAIILRTTRCKREILLAYDGCLIWWIRRVRVLESTTIIIIFIVNYIKFKLKIAQKHTQQSTFFMD